VTCASGHAAHVFFQFGVISNNGTMILEFGKSLPTRLVDSLGRRITCFLSHGCSLAMNDLQSVLLFGSADFAAVAASGTFVTDRTVGQA
jgi:hypothetical protein